MSDIVTRLGAWIEEKYPLRGHATGELLRDAKAEIERLREALETIVNHQRIASPTAPSVTRFIAERALAAKGEGKA